MGGWSGGGMSRVGVGGWEEGWKVEERWKKV